MDRSVRAWWADGGVRVVWVEARGVIAETARRHGVTPGTEAGLLRELVLANLLLAAWVKGEERATLQVRGLAPTFSFYGEVDAAGAFRGRMTPGHAIGVEGLATAQMLTIKYDAVRELYRGQTAFEQDTLELAFERHLRTSDQVDVAVSLREDGRAVLLERMPDEPGRPTLDREAWTALRLALDADPFVDVPTPEVGATAMWRGATLRVLEVTPLVFRCRCSDEKVHEMLATLGRDALLAMADEDHGAEIACHFCAETRQVDEPTLRAIAASVLLTDEH
ncbi:MAG: hypothetical protein RLZZ383_1520 [Pseudomonadota bacterium]